MNKTEQKKKLVENYLKSIFEGCELKITYEKHSQETGFYMNTTKYSLCGKTLLYVIDSSNMFKVSFCTFFLRELSKWVPVRGKKQFFRNWFFSKYLPNFEFKDQVSKKFSYYGLPKNSR